MLQDALLYVAASMTVSSDQIHFYSYTVLLGQYSALFSKSSLLNCI